MITQANIINAIYDDNNSRIRRYMTGMAMSRSIGTSIWTYEVKEMFRLIGDMDD